MSTALQWAVVMKMPIIFVTTDEIQNTFYGRSYKKYINHFATTLGSRLVSLNNVSYVTNWKDYLRIDKKNIKNILTLM
jgi:hypothetical protein